LLFVLHFPYETASACYLRGPDFLCGRATTSSAWTEELSLRYPTAMCALRYTLLQVGEHIIFAVRALHRFSATIKPKTSHLLADFQIQQYSKASNPFPLLCFVGFMHLYPCVQGFRGSFREAAFAVPKFLHGEPPKLCLNFVCDVTLISFRQPLYHALNIIQPRNQRAQITAIRRTIPYRYLFFILAPAFTHFLWDYDQSSGRFLYLRSVRNVVAQLREPEYAKRSASIACSRWTRQTCILSINLTNPQWGRVYQTQSALIQINLPRLPRRRQSNLGEYLSPEGRYWENE